MVRRVPPTNPGETLPLSPFEGYNFAQCKSMKNCQQLTGTKCCSKIICRFIGKVGKKKMLLFK